MERVALRQWTNQVISIQIAYMTMSPPFSPVILDGWICRSTLNLDPRCRDTMIDLANKIACYFAIFILDPNSSKIRQSVINCCAELFEAESGPFEKGMTHNV
jgi:hypothetical protein